MAMPAVGKPVLTVGLVNALARVPVLAIFRVVFVELAAVPKLATQILPTASGASCVMIFVTGVELAVEQYQLDEPGVPEPGVPE